MGAPPAGLACLGKSIFKWGILNRRRACYSY